MNVLYITYEDLNIASGVTKKIQAQCDGMRANGAEVHLYSIKSGDDGLYAVIDGERIFSYGPRIIRQIRLKTYYNHIVDYVTKNSIELVYVRFALDNPLMVFLYKKLKKLSIKVYLEIPTYPYDNERNATTLFFKALVFIGKITRRYFRCYVDKVVTVQNYDSILGIPTVKISNGIDLSKIKEREPQAHDEFNMVGVAHIGFWHGYDRIINGIGDYYNKGGQEDIHFYIIGDGNSIMEELRELAQQRKVGDRIHFEGRKDSSELDPYFSIADLAIGSLAGHRKGIIDAKPLKCVEYAARGIPFIYSEHNSDFDNTPFIMRFSEDDTPIDVENLLKFTSGIKYTPSMMRKYVEDNLTWAKQMKRIMESAR